MPLADWAFFLFNAVAGFLRHSLIVFSLDAFAIGVLGRTTRILTSSPDLLVPKVSILRMMLRQCPGCHVAASGLSLCSHEAQASVADGMLENDEILVMDVTKSPFNCSFC